MEGSNEVEKAPEDGSVVEQSQADLDLPMSAWQSVRALIDFNWWRDAVNTAMSLCTILRSSCGFLSTIWCSREHRSHR